MARLLHARSLEKEVGPGGATLLQNAQKRLQSLSKQAARSRAKETWGDHASERAIFRDMWSAFKERVQVVCRLFPDRDDRLQRAAMVLTNITADMRREIEAHTHSAPTAQRQHKAP